MTTVIKTFFIKKEKIDPNEINEKLKYHYLTIKNNESLKGDLYEINGRGTIRYDTNLFEILTYDERKNYQIKSELEKILNIKLIESKKNGKEKN